MHFLSWKHISSCSSSVQRKTVKIVCSHFVLGFGFLKIVKFSKERQKDKPSVSQSGVRAAKTNAVVWHMCDDTILILFKIAVAVICCCLQHELLVLFLLALLLLLLQVLMADWIEELSNGVMSNDKKMAKKKEK